jgi:hypothetical protein
LKAIVVLKKQFGAECDPTLAASQGCQWARRLLSKKSPVAPTISTAANLSPKSLREIGR